MEVTDTMDNPLSQSNRLDHPPSLYAKLGEKELVEKTLKKTIS